MKALDSVYIDAVNHFGVDSQLIVAIEEMAELTKELTKYKRGLGTTAGIAEELADVEIMLEQLRYIFSKKVGSLSNFNQVVEAFKEQKRLRLMRVIACQK